MEQRGKATDILARYIIIAAFIALVGGLCWYFRDIISYILIAAVLSLVGRPLMNIFEKVSIKGRKMPRWLSAVLSILLIFIIFVLVITLIVPVVSNVIKEVSKVNVGDTVKSISVPLHDFNEFLTDRFPGLGPGFRIENAIFEHIQGIFDVSVISSAISSMTSIVASVGVALFSIVFISFFFFKDKDLFSRIVSAIVPDRHEENAKAAIGDISGLLTRYFLGLLLEIAGVAILNFIGLLAVARLGFSASIGIAFITGIMNIIPYVGPMVGGAIGTVLAVAMKYVCATPLGVDVSFWVFIIMVVSVFCFTQIIDNYIFQPFIYSNSIKASPLEIFIIMLMAGKLGGMLGMLIAIPSYTAVRVIAGRFFRNVKFIRELIPDPSGNEQEKQNRK